MLSVGEWGSGGGTYIAKVVLGGCSGCDIKVHQGFDGGVDAWFEALRGYVAVSVILPARTRSKLRDQE